MHKKRFKIFFGLILIPFIVIFCRLFYLQIIEGGKYSGISDSRRIRTVGIDTLRGTIYDRNGLMLATDKHSFGLKVSYKKIYSAYSCFNRNILPKLSNVGNQEITQALCKECHANNTLWVSKITKYLEIPYADIFEKTTQIVKKVEKMKQAVKRKNKKKKIRIKEETIPHSIATDISWESVAKIKTDMSCQQDIWVDTKPVRWYTHGSLAPHIIGYVGKLNEKETDSYNFKKRWFDSLGKDSKFESDYFSYKALLTDVLVGKSGIEKVCNSRLMGIPGEKFEEITLDNLVVNKLILEKPPTPGNSIFLTIDSKLQGIAEKAIGNQKGSVVLMDPWNGEIIAMATSPGYNLNTLGKDYDANIKNPDKPFLNRPIQSTLPPGSIFKIVTAIAALEENKINEKSHVTCYGSVKLGRATFRCHSKQGHGLMNIEEGIQYSCNVFFFETAKKLGGPLLKKWAGKLGIGSVTGIELPYEKKGNIPKIRATYETLNMSIGQGALLVTPLQIAKVMATVANGGWQIKPHLLQKITDHENNVLLNNDSKPTEKVNISTKNLDIIKRALQKVVEAGTARRTGLKEFHAAGKTGTAQTIRDDRNHAWFAGFVPFENPKYCFAAVIEHTPGHGSTKAGPVILKLVSELKINNEPQSENSVNKEKPL
ncbi:MAG: penicillin-binding transpeptidase domain-containing protein [Planctomycetota bacterium]|jgi:penicillin-binding protein 2